MGRARSSVVPKPWCRLPMFRLCECTPSDVSIVENAQLSTRTTLVRPARTFTKPPPGTRSQEGRRFQESCARVSGRACILDRRVYLSHYSVYSMRRPQVHQRAGKAGFQH